MPKSVFSRAYRIFLEEFRAAREKFGTQEQVAKRIGQTQTFISKCERGERRVDAVELIAFCNVFGIDPAAFVRRIHIRIGKSPNDH
jgi:transcriptional regulator with XRE-family HTH domain